MNKKSGITFIETLMSVLVMGMVLGGMLGTFIMGRVSLAKAKHRHAACALIQQKLEEFTDTAYDSISDAAETKVTLDPGSSSSGDELLCSRTTTVSSLSYGKEVTVTVSWTERSWGGQKSVSESAATIFTDW